AARAGLRRRRRDADRVRESVQSPSRPCHDAPEGDGDSRRVRRWTASFAPTDADGERRALDPWRNSRIDPRRDWNTRHRAHGFGELAIAWYCGDGLAGGGVHDR